MISFLRGTIASKLGQQLVLDVGGVGYALKMSSISIGNVGAVGSEATVLVSMQVKEDGISLYGFASEQERHVFERLISVSSVGPKAALAALSTYDCPRLMSIIGTGDAASLAKVSGIGKKIAQRIAVDLSGEFASYVQGGTLLDDGGAPQGGATAAGAAHEALEALLSMGFTQEEGELALKGYTGNDDTGELVRYALKRLGSM